jgi:hypothetical protein
MIRPVIIWSWLSEGHFAAPLLVKMQTFELLQRHCQWQRKLLNFGDFTVSGGANF